jgi:hypothetical protein
VTKGEILEKWITFDTEMPYLPLLPDSLKQSKKKGQAVLFSPLKQGFNACTASFNIVC